MKIKNFKETKLDSTNFITPVKLTYIQNDTQKSWEAVKSFDSVSILLYHKQKDAFVLVKQFRPPVYLGDKSKLFTYELCAGIIDKDKSLKQIAKEEIEEECGYEVDVENIQEVTSFYTNVGVSGGKQNLYFSIVNESMRVGSGGGIESECIELVYLPVDEYEEMIFDEGKAKTPGLMYAFMWFMKNKEKLLGS